ncbi:MAG: acyl-CoA thioesterase, partial [Eubacteriales bacterium]
MQKLPDRTQSQIDGGYLWQDELVFGQCDSALNVRISTLLEQLVNAASQHCRTFGLSYDTFLESDTAFVLTRTTLTIHKLPHCFQLLTLKTWIDGIKGPYYQRVTEWYDENDTVMVSCRSDWVIIRPSTRTLTKPDKSDTRFTTKSPVSLPPCSRVKLGDIPLEPLGSHHVVWSEIDGNA